MRHVGRNAPRSLVVIWFHATRLETRTKESDACASLRVTETLRHNESELCLSRAKPEETLVEARSDSDVQIDRQTWV